ncbi:beta-ribofuranosylaminobenzene 5'-phosphate synthase family protein [Brevifollis gellanilyticus]|uniref:beta-ribofuranosylaminobenzene 5'-phosphate synthase family protein n=1 Tax=Brevifollis gellanilyticus TaxID=748831 RepID=UPI00147960BC|nr:beta-ribofuranosylaminobenzene 5'-phosphate synthase family protein [Brevifollis gellanilyticus]
MAPLFTIEAPARIHISLINESGVFGRVDGGIGFAVTEPKWVIDIHLSDSKDDKPVTEVEVLIDQAMAKLGQRFPRALSLKLNVRHFLASHIGLGAKTSLLLAAARAVCEVEGLAFDAIEMAGYLGRGGTSGVGVHLSDGGGIVWDIGRKYPHDKSAFGPSSLSLAPPPPLLLRRHAEWLHVVHFRVAEIGIFGKAEVDIFKKHCPVSSEETCSLIGITASQIFPALIEHDEEALQQSLSSIQDLGLKKIEWDHQHDVTKQFREYWLQNHQEYALGLSSMGPTMYVLTSKPEDVKRAITQSGFHFLHLTMTSISDSGFIISYPKIT